MKSFSLNRKTNTKGFGLLEVILVFAIVIGAAAVVFTVFQSAKPSADASNEGSNISTLATNVKSTYGINGDYAGLDLSGAIAAKAVPASMVTAPDAASNSWGGDVDVAVNGTNSRLFDITYNAVPADVCTKLVAGVAGFFPKGISVAGTDVMTNGKLNAGEPATTCGADDTDKILVFTSN